MTPNRDLRGDDFEEEHPSWSIAGIDPHTPVVDLRAAADLGRDTFVLFSYSERETMDYLIREAQGRRAVTIMNVRQRAWHETLWGRGGVLAAWVLAGIELYRVSTGK